MVWRADHHKNERKRVLSCARHATTRGQPFSFTAQQEQHAHACFLSFCFMIRRKSQPTFPQASTAAFRTTSFGGTPSSRMSDSSRSADRGS